MGADTYTTATTILGPSRGSPAAWLQLLDRRLDTFDSVQERPEEIRRYLEEVYRLAPKAGIRAELAITQAIHETGWFSSFWWRERLNPAGLGITGDPAQDAESRVFPSGTSAARAHLVHLALYAIGTELPAALKPYQSEDPRWAAARGHAGKRTTIQDFEGSWAMDARGKNGSIGYAAKWVSTLNATMAQLDDDPSDPATTDTSPTEDTPMATHRFILSAGHRNTDAGGAWKGPESAWTYPMCKKVKAEIERRGGKAWIAQEEDGDRDPSNSIGRGLQNVAYMCVDLAKTVGGVDAYLSMHYGAEPVDGFFCVFPDSTGLSPNSSTDVRSNNTLDIRLARTFAKHVAKTGMPIRGDGTMSETKSQVGTDGYRLGELYGTRALQPTTPRLIVEAGNSLDPAEFALLWSDAWQDKYAKALVDGLEEEFGKFSGKPVPAPQPKPEVDPNAGKPRTFTLRFETPIRTSPGFWDTENNKSNVIKNMPAGTKGRIKDGPKNVDGIDFYDLEIDGFGSGWLQDQVLHTLEIKG